MVSEWVIVMFQAVCCGEAAWLGLWWKAMYWAGAMVITVAVMGGLRS